MYRDRDIDSSGRLALNGRQEDSGMDLAHAVLGALLLAEIVIAIIGFVHLHKRSEIHQGVAAATFLHLRKLEEFVKSSKPSASRSS